MSFQGNANDGTNDITGALTPQALLRARRAELISIVLQSIGEPASSAAFAARIMGDQLPNEVTNRALGHLVSTDEVKYAGTPQLAALGFSLGAKQSSWDQLAAPFVAGFQALQGRTERGLAAFVQDDVALLGVAEGLAHLTSQNLPTIEDARTWLTAMIDNVSGGQQWTSRMRYLAADLLDGRGRLRVAPDRTPDSLALEAALRTVWQRPFLRVPAIADEDQFHLFQDLLISSPPQIGDVERAATWVVALDSIVDVTTKRLFPTVSDTVQVLNDVQHALKRWKWEEKSSRKDAMPARWLIDDEYDVQSLLWAILYPIYRADLVDEQYLPGWGNVQPRADLGIMKLKLIIEVKIARTQADFKKIEEEVAGDLGIYFKDTAQFDRLIAFVYDDCDTAHPEKYESLRKALKQRERSRGSDYSETPRQHTQSRCTASQWDQQGHRGLYTKRTPTQPMTYYLTQRSSVQSRG